MADRFSHWSHCYGCGPKNDRSEGIVLERAGDDEVSARVYIDRDHGGAPGFAHGGYLSLLLDEVMGGVAPSPQPRVTTDLQVRFLRAVPLDSDVLVTARLREREDQGFSVQGSVRVGGAEEVAVEATAYFRFVDLSRLRRRS
ncbi:MAG: PaaI family thioesterase [Acidobacteriota bacterium]|nr:PaaI family thioesterase [Acidobacteriota bacterium]